MLKKLKKRLKNQKGFTLIELLAVIVILGIIAAIAVPAIGNIISNSRVDAVKQDAIQVLNAAKLYDTQTPIVTGTPVTINDIITAGYLEDTTIDTTGTISKTATGVLELSADSSETNGLIYTFTNASIQEINDDANWSDASLGTAGKPITTAD